MTQTNEIQHIQIIAIQIIQLIAIQMSALTNFSKLTASYADIVVLH